MAVRHYVNGDWLFVCDQCGWEYYGSQGKEQWDHAFVCANCWESRQPQDFVRGVKDETRVPVARPRAYPNYTFIHD